MGLLDVVDIQYPSVEKIIELNILAIMLIKAKKADVAKVMSRSVISDVLADCVKTDGDVYDKAAVLLRGIIQKHPFASGNRRTAFVTMQYFLSENNKKTGIDPDGKQIQVMRGIREGFYTHEDIKTWIQHGFIKEFKR